ncbi:GerMN domain-containing protein [Streptomyces sp. NPDC059989]|uniref:GerMN domain-containing protein n=1 Tax=Streptomyces sp. NPDC059989 TaxID=3347026 RepID=UPI0036B003B5
MRGGAAAATLAGCALLLAGCGIKPTGVIESGHAATVEVPGAGGPVLYFVSREGDRLVPAPVFSDGYRMEAASLLQMLLAGPAGRAREAGLTTALPPPGDARQASVAFAEPADSELVTAQLPFKVGDLSELARGQLVCTLAFAGAPGTLNRVTLRGTDTALSPAECELVS